jgi:hypothetical protein
MLHIKGLSMHVHEYPSCCIMLGWSGRQEHDSRAQHRWRGSGPALYSYPSTPLPLLLSQSSYFWPLGMMAPSRDLAWEFFNSLTHSRQSGK